MIRPSVSSSHPTLDPVMIIFMIKIDDNDAIDDNGNDNDEEVVRKWTVIQLSIC